jgi:shikimate dehydrogenase
MDRYAVIGHPVKHSRSPAIHALFAAQSGQALQYERLESPLEGFTATVQAFAASGAKGCNVTVPFKFEAFQLARRRSERAELAQAANTLRFDAEGWWADNTDGAGLVRDIQHNAGVALAGKTVLLIGAGGAAAGVLGPLLAARPSALWLLNRTVAKADELVQRHARLATGWGVPLHSGPLDQAPTACDIVINGSASSLAGSEAPVDARALRRGGLALDMMYGAAALPFLAWARSHGAQGRDGLGMLVEQAAESFWAWRGVRPDTAPVLAQLRAEVDATLPVQP